jgi:2-oxoglutarate dehydrogenase E2 component (dihydrolipoamide succinyltransferase)
MREAIPVLVPCLNPNDEHAVLVEWHVASGAWVESEQVLATVETTKATYDVPAPAAGYALFDCEPHSLLAVGAPFAWISDRADRPLPHSGSEAAQALTDGEARFTRKALRLMREHDLSASDFPARGRIDTAEVERVVQRAHEGRAKSAVAAAQGSPHTIDIGTERLHQAPAKILEIARLSAVYEHAIPSTVVLGLSGELLSRRLRMLAERFGPLSFLEAAIHDAGRTLREFPELNAFHADGSAWHYPSVNIGFAVNAGHSLRVPVVRDADDLSYRDVARAARDLSLRYARDELSAIDVADGTFTITDLSSHGVVNFVPVLNHRQSAVLGLCAERPATRERNLVLTFDHRLSDGMQAAMFLSKLAGRLVSDTID